MESIQQFVVPVGMLNAVKEKREEIWMLTDEQILEIGLRWLIANPSAVYDLVREGKRA